VIKINAWPLGAFCAVLALASGQVRAAGFEILEQSAEAQGTAQAGAGARADDPSTVFFNPAGVTMLPGIQIGGNVTGIFLQTTPETGSASTASYLGGMPYSTKPGGNAGFSVAVPDLYDTAQLTDTLFAGVAITSPFGLVTKYGADSIVSNYALTTHLQTINIGPAIAWKVMPNFSIAAGLNVETAQGHLSNAVDFGAIGALSGLAAYGYLPGTHIGSATINGSDTAVGWNLGALYEPLPGTHIGLTYRSAMFHDLSGSVNYNNVPLPLASSFQSASANAKLPEPSIAILSVAQAVGDWTILGSLTYTGWSIFHNLTAYSGGSPISTTVENFHDTVAVAVGADYRLNDKVTLRAGTMFDPTPVQNADRTPRLPDADRYNLSVGATYRPLPALSLSAAYTHIFTQKVSVDQVDAGPGTPNFLRGDLIATFNSSIDVLSVEASYRF
jgi:long-chain fatty acid transport protein